MTRNWDFCKKKDPDNKCDNLGLLSYARNLHLQIHYKVNELKWITVAFPQKYESIYCAWCYSIACRMKTSMYVPFVYNFRVFTRPKWKCFGGRISPPLWQTYGFILFSRPQSARPRQQVVNTRAKTFHFKRKIKNPVLLTGFKWLSHAEKYPVFRYLRRWNWV